MERLTTYNERFGRYQIDGDSGNVMIDGFHHIIGDSVERLAAYENTGLTPEEIQEDLPDVRKIEEKLAAYEDAEEQGLLVRLPRKVGDTVYRIEYVLGENNPAGYVIGVAERKFNLLLLDEFGKTVFLTREEAEAALAKEG